MQLYISDDVGVLKCSKPYPRAIVGMQVRLVVWVEDAVPGVPTLPVWLEQRAISSSDALQ